MMSESAPVAAHAVLRRHPARQTGSHRRTAGTPVAADRRAPRNRPWKAAAPAPGGRRPDRRVRVVGRPPPALPGEPGWSGSPAWQAGALLPRACSTAWRKTCCRTPWPRRGGKMGIEIVVRLSPVRSLCLRSATAVQPSPIILANRPAAGPAGDLRRRPGDRPLPRRPTGRGTQVPPAPRREPGRPGRLQSRNPAHDFPSRAAGSGGRLATDQPMVRCRPCP